MIGKEEVSLYFHIPFCTHKCGYCHFYVIPDKHTFKKTLIVALKKEWQIRLPELINKKIVSIYFGGGTPFLFGPENIHTILAWIKEDLNISLTNIEITLEANPENITSSLMLEYFLVGINRVSIGIQTLDDSLLGTLERKHSSHKAIDAVYKTAEAGIDNITVDLMYDLPGQTLSIWEKTLSQVVQLPIKHLSLYNLTIEPHTTFFKKQEELTKVLPDPEESLKMYEMAQEILENSGLKQYEISAFAKTPYQSLHNSGYWKARPFLGFGPSAFSYWQQKRFRNIPNIHRYSMLLKDEVLPIDFEEKLDPKEAIKELLTIQIRLTEGVNLKDFEEKNGPLEKETLLNIEDLIKNDLIIKDKDHIKLSKKGILFYDTVAVELI